MALVCQASALATAPHPDVYRCLYPSHASQRPHWPAV